MPAAAPLTATQEAERLCALRPYRELMHSHNRVFGQVAQLTARLFAMPISLLSLVDAEVVAYPGRVGMPEVPDTLPRRECICAVAVFQPNEATVFENLREQPCQWVPAEVQAGFDFYASFPLLAGGQPIGTLCVLDREPRLFGATEQLELRRMADVARRLLDLELLAAPAVAPRLWATIESRVQWSLQRIETLTALARWEPSPTTQPARTYLSTLHEERMLIIQDIEFQVSVALSEARQLAQEA